MTQPKTEMLEAPIGLDAANPAFSWRVEGAAPGWRQAACQIQLWSGGGTPLWDSGRIETNRQLGHRYGGPALHSDSVYNWRVQVWDASGNCAESEAASFTTGLLAPADWQGEWIGETEDYVAHLYRSAFDVGSPLDRASLFVYGLGHCELLLNGQKVGDRALDPGWTGYTQSCLYSAYDVTKALCQGKNALGVMLGDGMYNVPGGAAQGRFVYYPRSYGKMKLRVQLNLHYADGTTQCVTTGPHWRMAKSPITFACIYGGEDYDARLEQPGWATAAFTEDESWQPAPVVPPPQGALVCQTMPPVKVMERYTPVTVTNPAPGVYLYDLGYNFSGWPRISITAGSTHAGREITLKPSEIVDAQNRADQRTGAPGGWWKYTLNGEALQDYAPRFSYTGFRYVELQGATPREFAQAGESGPIIESLTGEFLYPAIQAAGGFICSNPLYNNIHRIVTQAMKSNIKSYFTDCPHREKLGWMEQTHLIGPGLLYNYELFGHYLKILRDMREAQHENGLVPDICPQYLEFGYHRGFNDSPEWGSASVMVLWYLYRRYGDAALLAGHYGMMCRYVDYLTTQTHHHVLHHGLGDWLDVGPNPSHSQNTPVPVVTTCMYHLDLTVMAETASILGKEADAEKYGALAAAVRREFRAQFLDKQNTRSIFVANGSQAAQAMALMCGMIDEDEVEHTLLALVTDIEKRGWATTAGDVGHPFVVAALIRHGRSDVMDRMLHDTEHPGYGYQVKHGATSLTEDWDGPNPAGPHGSQNHFMLGAVEEWFYSGLAGLGSLRDGQPFDEMQIKPHFAQSCNEVEAWTLHPYGRVWIRWKKRPGAVDVELEIPAGLSALFENELDGSSQRLPNGRHMLELKAPNI